MKTIKSSEISNYIYCPTGWWIEKTGGIKITEQMEKGLKDHKIIAENQPKARNYYIALLVTIIIFIILLLGRFLV